MRKAAILLLLLFFVGNVSIQAQQTTVVVENAADEDDLHFKIGALAGLTLAMNTSDYQVSRVSRFLGLGSDFGVRASIPLGRKTRVVGGIGYHTLSFKDENKRISFNDNLENHSTDIPDNGTLTTTGSFQYTVLTAMLQFSQFFVGFSVGLPVASEMKNSLGSDTFPAGGFNPADWSGNSNLDVGRRIKEDITPSNDEINTLLELRIGGEFPIIKAPLGDLNFGISLGWTFNQILKYPDKNSQEAIPSTSIQNNLPNYSDQFYLPSVLFHLSYMFNI
ncbi:MAG: hypothetical protein WBQ23_01115 [Bacteroidota bacterium]